MTSLPERQPYATLSDLTTRWRAISPSETTRAETLLADAADLIRASVPRVDERIEAGTLSPYLPLIVSCDMVRRAMAADDVPVTAANESVGPWSYGQTFAAPSGDMYLTKAELRRLGGGQQVGMVNLIPDPGKARR